MYRRTFLLTCLASLGCGATPVPAETADGENAPGGEGRPTTQPADAHIERQLRVVELDGTLYCELTLLNPSLRRITVPRYPSSLSIRALDVRGEHLGGGRARMSGVLRSKLFRHRGELELGPGEGFIKRLSFDRPP